MSTLEKISKALAGETLTGLARGAGEAIGYVGAGGDFSDVPQVMKDAIEAQKKRLETGSQGEKDAYSALSALGLVTNPASQIGMGIDFAKALPDLVSAIPERAKAYMAGTPDPVGTIAESGLKRRLAKGGAQAEFAKANRMQRVDAKMKPFYETVTESLSKIPEGEAVKLPQESWQMGMRAFSDFPSGSQFTDYLNKNRLSVGLTPNQELTFRKQPDLSNVLQFPQELIRKTPINPLEQFTKNPFGIRADVLEGLFPNMQPGRPKSVNIGEYDLEKQNLPFGEYYKVRKKNP